MAECADNHTPLHWGIVFAKEMQQGGFDVVLANPPWEVIKLSDKEFFAARAPKIAVAPNASARKKMIAALNSPDATPYQKNLYREYQLEKRTAKAQGLFLRKGGRYPLTGRGDVNTYAVFAETILQLLSPTGRAGIIVPTGIATDYGTRKWINEVVKKQRLVSLYDFENQKQLFKGVSNKYRFSLITLTGMDSPCETADYAFYLHQIEDLAEEERHVSLSAEDFALFTPNTATCPTFRSRRDMEIARKMYRKAGVLWKEGSADGNPWGVKMSSMFHMSNDSNLFRRRQELEYEGYELQGNIFVKGEKRFLPLYEGKLFHQYDHRFSTFRDKTPLDVKKGRTRPVTMEEKQDPEHTVIPRYWVEESHVKQKLLKINDLRLTPPPIYDESASVLEDLARLARKSISERSLGEPTTEP